MYFCSMWKKADELNDSEAFICSSTFKNIEELEKHIKSILWKDAFCIIEYDDFAEKHGIDMDKFKK